MNNTAQKCTFVAKVPNESLGSQHILTCTGGKKGLIAYFFMLRFIKNRFLIYTTGMQEIFTLSAAKTCLRKYMPV
jgi:hypothetical protein